MQTAHKNQHYVPVKYYEYFTNSKKIYVFNLNKLKFYLTPICELDFKTKEMI